MEKEGNRRPTANTRRVHVVGMGPSLGNGQGQIPPRGKMRKPGGGGGEPGAGVPQIGHQTHWAPLPAPNQEKRMAPRSLENADRDPRTDHQVDLDLGEVIEVLLVEVVDPPIGLREGAQFVTEWQLEPRAEAASGPVRGAPATFLEQ